MPKSDECGTCQRNQQRCDAAYGYWLGYKNALRACGKYSSTGLKRAERLLGYANKTYENHRRTGHPPLLSAMAEAISTLGALNQGEVSTQREIDAARILRIARDGAS